MCMQREALSIPDASLQLHARCQQTWGASGDGGTCLLFSAKSCPLFVFGAKSSAGKHPDFPQVKKFFVVSAELSCLDLFQASPEVRRVRSLAGLFRGFPFPRNFAGQYWVERIEFIDSREDFLFRSQRSAVHDLFTMEVKIV